MKMNRDYPLIMIDRAQNKPYLFDYITCLDREVGFVAKVVVYHDNIVFNQLLESSSKVDDGDISILYHRFKVGGMAIVVLDFLYNLDLNNPTKSRIKTLLKKALKKYLHATSEREMSTGELSLDNQIKQQRLTIERARANYEELLKRAPSKEEADYSIALAEATLETLEKFRELMKIRVIN